MQVVKYSCPAVGIWQHLLNELPRGSAGVPTVRDMDPFPHSMARLKGPIHDSDLQSQPQFPTATSTKFPVYVLQQPQPQPQLAGRGCCWSEFSDIWWAELKVAVEVAVVYGQKRSNMSHKRRYLHAFELVHWYKWNFPGQTGSEIIYHAIWLLIIKVAN